MTRTLVLGGARSGKSKHAEILAAACGKSVVYVATARAGDQEMAARIALHRQQRNAEWTTIEEPVALGALIQRESQPERVILMDCMTIWLANLLFDGTQDDLEYPEIGVINPPPRFQEQRAALLHALKQASGDVIIVSNEVGMGIVPTGAISRWFVDEAGRLNQDLAAICDRVLLVVAGLPLTLKG